MKSSLKYIILGLAIAAVVGMGYVMKFGLYPQYFDIAWDEEVQLHDGRVIVVSVKRTFERRGWRIGRWDGHDRDTIISFSTGSSLGQVSRVFKNYDVNLIEEWEGNWYFGLATTTGIPPIKMVDPAYPILILHRDGTEQAAKSWADVPDFPRLNLMPVTPSPEGISQFANTRLSWQTKMAHWQNNQRAAGDTGIIIQRRVFKQEHSK